MSMPSMSPSSPMAAWSEGGAGRVSPRSAMSRRREDDGMDHRDPLFAAAFHNTLTCALAPFLGGLR